MGLRREISARLTWCEASSRGWQSRDRHRAAHPGRPGDDARAEHTFREASERVTAGPPAAKTILAGRTPTDQFHEAILHAANVYILTRVDPRPASGGAPNLTWSAIRSPRLLAENVDQHARIRAAMEVGDCRPARAAMRLRISGDPLS